MPAWLDTQYGVPEITVSPDECSCEDSSKVYRPLQCQIQGAIPYGKFAPSRCTVHCNSMPIPEAVCCAEPKRDNNGLHGWQGRCPSGRPWYVLVHWCKTTQQSTCSNRRPWTSGNEPWLLHQWSCPIFLKSRLFPYSHNEIIKKTSHPSHFTKLKIQTLHFFISLKKKSPCSYEFWKFQIQGPNNQFGVA